MLPDPGQSTLSTARRWRIALYSHDTMGLGHKRRNLLIAQTLGTALNADILLISGMRDASTVATPPGVDYLALPALYKRADGTYEARHLGLSLAELVGLRSQLIRTAIKSFQPDVLIVDNVPRGAVRELDPTLEYVKSQPHIRCILGLRDVLDTPEAVRRDWQQADNETAIRRYYTAVWIYGDASLYDPRVEYGFAPDIVAKMTPLGYLDQRPRLAHASPHSRDRIAALTATDESFVACFVGGGQDGAALAAAFTQVTFAPQTRGILVTGPLMPPEVRQRLHRRATKNPRLRVMEYLEEPTLLLERASRAIAMGGYNTTCEVLSFQTPALIVPRVSPRQEQWIRAERLQKRGLVDILHPSQVSPAALTTWLQQPLSPVASQPINLNGLENLLSEVHRLLLTDPLASSQAS